MIIFIMIIAFLLFLVLGYSLFHLYKIQKEFRTSIDEHLKDFE